MFLNIHEMGAEKVRFDKDFPPGAIEFHDRKLWQVGPLHAEGTAELLEHTGGEIRIQGHLAVEMGAECDLCLDTASYPVDLDFDLFYEPAKAGPEGAEIALAAEDSAVDFYKGDGLELEDVLREQVLLALPMKRICREDCQGICPACGGDRNRVQCGCQVKAPDDRWAALRNI